jgi:hypothetical protein
MNITPTTWEYASKLATKIAVYDTQEKKPVLLFRSATLCTHYLFKHLIFTVANRNTYIRRILYYSAKKKIDTDNCFAKPLAFRVMKEELAAQLGDLDYLVLDENYYKEEFNKENQPKYREYHLETLLKVGDIIEITQGSFTGASGKIVEKTNKRGGRGKFLYGLDIRGKREYFKANVLELLQETKTKNV